jgi:hypothetical protein
MIHMQSEHERKYQVVQNENPDIDNEQPAHDRGKPRQKAAIFRVPALIIPVCQAHLAGGLTRHPAACKACASGMALRGKSPNSKVFKK